MSSLQTASFEMHVTGERPRIKSPGAGHELLEELLTYDDLFLEYFNAFLTLPVFPLRLHYDRLTGWLQELDGFMWESPSQLEAGPNSPCYGATDEERERALSWLTKERFLPFQRTISYLEYKLAKLLVCPLDEKFPASRYAIRGYSRQSDSVAVSSIPSHLSTARLPTGVPSHVLLRLPSQTRSTPACLGRFASFSGQIPIEMSLEFPGVLCVSQSPTEECLSRLQLQRLLSDSRAERTNGRLMSGWTNAGEPVVSSVHLSRAAAGSLPDQEFTDCHMDGSDEKTHLGSRKVLQFDLNEASEPEEDQQDSCLSYGFGSAALQQLKEDLLGTKAGMDSFREFLHGTLGIHLLDFWIDCEDVMEHTKHLETTATPQEIQLFIFNAARSIQAKYKLTVPPASQEQLDETISTEETAFASLSQKQYDALRRLRSYWVPRFLIHHERTRQLRHGPNADFKLKEEPHLISGFLPSLNIVTSLPVMSGQRDMMSSIKKNKDRRMPFRERGRGRNGSAEQPELPADAFETLTTITRFLQALMYDLGEGDSFLHYLSRFEGPQKVHNLLLWRKLKVYEAAWEQQASQPELHHIALQIFNIFLKPDAGCNTGLCSSIPEYIQHLKKMLYFGCGDLKPSTFEPVTHCVLSVLSEAWFHYLRHEVATFLEYCVPASFFDVQSIRSKDHTVKQEISKRRKHQRQNTWFHDPKGRGLHRKTGRKKAVPRSHPISSADQETSEKSLTPQDAPAPQNAPHLLSNPVVLNVYRKAAHKMQDKELQRVLGLLQEVETCQDVLGSEKHLGCAVKLLEIWGQPRVLGSTVCLTKELKKRLKKEVSQGEISDLSWNEVRLALHSLIAPDFERFWDEVSEGMKKRGVQPSRIPEERWSKLEPFLHSLAARVALRRLRNQKAKVGSAATAQPTREDKTSFWQFVQNAAEGWPTSEMLHFLKHLQVHGPPVLESGLHFLLEVQKFKNAHHDWPDMALLKKKILVIRGCFLASQIEPRLQVAVDAQRLGRAIRAVEQALQKEIPVPPPGLFDELKHSVFNILLPYWAAFQKHWLKRSPASAEKAPVLRRQLLLQKRRAMLEGPCRPPQPLQLPHLHQTRGVQGSKGQDGFTYTFSISEGLTLQGVNKESRSHSKTSSSVPGNKNRSTGFQFPSLSNVPVI